MTCTLLLVLCQSSAGLASWGDAATPGRGNPHIDVVHYDLHLHLQPPAPWLRAIAELSFIAQVELLQMELDFHHDLRVSRILEGDLNLSYEQRERRLRIELSKKLPKGAATKIRIEYAGELPEDASQGEPVGLLSDRLGIVSYLQPDGAHHFYPCNDHPADKATYTVRLHVPHGHFGAATGALRNWQIGIGGQSYQWETRHPTSSYLLAVAAGPYAPIVRPGSTLLLDLPYARDYDRVMDRYAVMSAMLEFMQERFGSFPFERYGHVFTNRPIGGLENQTMSVIGRGAGLGGNQPLLIHELAHQWFGDWVGPATWKDLWLNEGWATYAELLWMESRAGKRARRTLLRGWRQSVLIMERQRWTLANPNPRNLFDFHLVYNKGGLVLHQLAEVLGRESFEKGARFFLRKFAGGNANTTQFQEAMSQGSGTDLSEFFAAWIHSNALPVLQGKLHSKRLANGRYSAGIHLSQPAKGLWHPLMVEVRLQGDDQDRFLDLPLRMLQRTLETEVELPFEPLELILDPHRELPWKESDGR